MVSGSWLYLFKSIWLMELRLLSSVSDRFPDWEVSFFTNSFWTSGSMEFYWKRRLRVPNFSICWEEVIWSEITEDFFKISSLLEFWIDFSWDKVYFFNNSYEFLIKSPPFSVNFLINSIWASGFLVFSLNNSCKVAYFCNSWDTLKSSSFFIDECLETPSSALEIIDFLFIKDYCSPGVVSFI